MVSREENSRRVGEGGALSEISGERSGIGRDEGSPALTAPKTEALGMKTENLSAFYGSFKAVSDVDMQIRPNKVTALIGPSGCGKSTFMRCLNRMHEVIPSGLRRGMRQAGRPGHLRKDTDPVTIRRRIGMVFQKPNPFSKSIYENVAWGARINGYKGDMDELVERSLKRAALWDEVKDKLKRAGSTCRGGSSSAWSSPERWRSSRR
jgi:phosphate transport system ATP-binding protein